MQSVIKGLQNNIRLLKIEKDISCKKLSFMRTGGVVSAVIYPSSLIQLFDAISFLENCGVSYFALGNGSNILFSDGVVNSIAVSTKLLNQIKVCGQKVFAQSGASLSAVANVCLKNNLTGFEALSKIPGTVGGAIITNAGAGGQNIGQMVDAVYSNLQRFGVQKKDCLFEYRKSRFTNTQDIITLIEFDLAFENRRIIEQNMQIASNLRAQRQPSGASLGSIFTNPAGDFAGRLIEQANLKGITVGGACVSKKHANFILNESHATSSQVFKLINIIKQTVNQKFGIMLQEEIHYIGDFN